MSNKYEYNILEYFKGATLLGPSIKTLLVLRK